MTDQPTLDDLFQQMRNFRTRPAAVNALRERGGEAVDRLTDLLKGNDIDQAWLAAQLLGDIGDERAIEPLKERAGHPDLITIIRDALEKLGEEREDEIKVARPYADRDATDLTDAQLLEAAVSHRHVLTKREHDDSWTVPIPLGDEEVPVKVVFPRDDEDGATVTVYVNTEVEAKPEHFEKVLRLNTRLPHGAVGIQTLRGNDVFVLTETQLRETADPPELEKAIFNLAGYARKLKERLH